jgi:hypothetical protein
MLLHLGPGDLLSAPATDLSLRTLAPASPGNSSDHALPPNLRLPLCAGAAHGMRTAGTDRLTLAYTEAGTPETGWADALTWAQRDQLPLLLVCADAQPRPARRGSRSNRRSHTPLTWPAMGQLARKLRLPLFPVDGLDAVAVFRVMQESSARARARGGPSVVWAVLSPDRLPRRQQPLARLEAYMAARNIALDP